MEVNIVPSLGAGGFDIEGCVPVCLVVLVVLVGAAFAYQGAMTSNYPLMLTGILMVLGTLALAGGGYIKAKF